MNAQGVMVMGMPVNRLAVPMLVLYEVSILGSWLAARGRA